MIKPSFESLQDEPRQTLREATPKYQPQKNSGPGVLRVEFVVPSSLWVISTAETSDLGQ